MSLFGDKLNAKNIAGCAVVFFGVILYKIVFHLEKKEKEGQLLGNTKCDQDDMYSGLIRHGKGGTREAGHTSTTGLELSDRKDRSVTLRSNRSKSPTREGYRRASSASSKDSNEDYTAVV